MTNVLVLKSFPTLANGTSYNVYSKHSAKNVAAFIFCDIMTFYELLLWYKSKLNLTFFLFKRNLHTIAWLSSSPPIYFPEEPRPFVSQTKVEMVWVGHMLPSPVCKLEDTQTRSLCFHGRKGGIK